MLTLKIDCKKIDKSRLFEGKNGAMYLDAVLIDTPNDKHGNDYMVVQSITKEERERGMKGNIIGNAKNLGPKNQNSGSSNQSDSGVNSDALPF